MKLKKLLYALTGVYLFQKEEQAHYLENKPESDDIFYKKTLRSYFRGANDIRRLTVWYIKFMILFDIAEELPAYKRNKLIFAVPLIIYYGTLFWVNLVNEFYKAIGSDKYCIGEIPDDSFETTKWGE